MLAAMVFINTLPILIYPEPKHRAVSEAQPTPFNLQQIKNYLAYFVQSPVLVAWLAVLLSFKIADGLAGPLLKPLMVDLGLSFSQIGLYVTMLGACAALIGAGLAGYSLKLIRRATALVLYSVLKIFSLAAYTWLAFQYENQHSIQPWLIYLINAFEDMTSSMLLVVMLTLVMQYSRKHLAGTDFTFQVALMATVSGGLYSVSGLLGDWLGYFNYLCMIVVIAMLSLWFIFKWRGIAMHSDLS